jgi:hypothetical protein
MESSLLQLDSNTNVEDESTEITSTTTICSVPGDSLANGMNTPRPENAKQEKIDKESYDPEKLQMSLVSFKPTLSKETIKTRKGQQLQEGNTISGGDQQRAALILEDVIKEIPVAKEKLLKNTVDTDIVSSIGDIGGSFGIREEQRKYNIALMLLPTGSINDTRTCVLISLCKWKKNI